MKRKIQSIFLKASARGHVDTVSHLLRHHGQSLLSAHTSDGSTAVLLAAKRGQLDVLRTLFQYGATWRDCDADNKRQGNVIHYACWGGHQDLVQWLIDEFDPDLDCRDVVGNTPLLYAVYGGHMHIVDLLLSYGRSLHEHNQKYHTAILQAACGGHKHLLTYLLQQGFSISECDHDGNTALLFAAWGGHRDLMEFLLANGASLQEKNFNGHSVFLSAANGGRTEIVEWLLQEGFDIHETNNNGDTALLLACYGGHLELVQRLLQLGATMTDRNSCGFSPLLSAANGGQKEMAAWLLNNGSRITEADNDGYTALILAACGGNVDLVKFFLEKGASLTEKNTNGDTPLLLAAYCGHTELVEWLLDNGASAVERNNSGMGVLISASNGGHVDTVRVLHRRMGAYCLEEKDEGGYTPLLLAAQRGHLEVVQYLASYGADIKAHTTRHDSSALTLAADHPHVLAFLQYVIDMTPIEVACVLRNTDRVHEMIRGGFDIHRTPNCMALASADSAFPNAPAVDEELVRLIKAAMCAWSPLSHQLFSTSFRQKIVELMWVKKQLDLQRHLPFLPAEMWFHILSFVQRGWVAEDYAASIVPFSTETEAVYRVAWRHKYLHKSSKRESICCSEPVASRRRSSVPHLAELDCYSSASLIEVHHVDLVGSVNESQSGRVTPFLHDEDDQATTAAHNSASNNSNASSADTAAPSGKHTWSSSDVIATTTSSSSMACEHHDHDHAHASEMAAKRAKSSTAPSPFRVVAAQDADAGDSEDDLPVRFTAFSLVAKDAASSQMRIPTTASTEEMYFRPSATFSASSSSLPSPDEHTSSSSMLSPYNHEGGSRFVFHGYGFESSSTASSTQDIPSTCQTSASAKTTWV